MYAWASAGACRDSDTRVWHGLELCGADLTPELGRNSTAATRYVTGTLALIRGYAGTTRGNSGGTWRASTRTAVADTEAAAALGTRDDSGDLHGAGSKRDDLATGTTVRGHSAPAWTRTVRRGSGAERRENTKAATALSAGQFGRCDATRGSYEAAGCECARISAVTSGQRAMKCAGSLQDEQANSHRLAARRIYLARWESALQGMGVTMSKHERQRNEEAWKTHQLSTQATYVRSTPAKPCSTHARRPGNAYRISASLVAASNWDNIAAGTRNRTPRAGMWGSLAGGVESIELDEDEHASVGRHAGLAGALEEREVLHGRGRPNVRWQREQGGRWARTLESIVAPWIQKPRRMRRVFGNFASGDKVSEDTFCRVEMVAEGKSVAVLSRAGMPTGAYRASETTGTLLILSCKRGERARRAFSHDRGIHINTDYSRVNLAGKRISLYPDSAPNHRRVIGTLFDSKPGHPEIYQVAGTRTARGAVQNCNSSRKSPVRFGTGPSPLDMLPLFLSHVKSRFFCRVKRRSQASHKGPLTGRSAPT
ncbi:hypothetical protein DFH07DRAFT_777500 [Mycena maculata]|uniref:Uncharacterized protein n=1 Tax=Mycena maculata TaxID=230809 RepID=A0AAD7N3K6_9AGAR|nr:hypothetical protein DFH07DRAFT_777500 [Mycena maculata]